jgi:predicted aminopeptidase
MELIKYVLGQARGQLEILWNTRPVSDCLADPDFSQAYKHKLNLIQDIRQFAFDSLQIKRTENYTTFYDQQGEAILWVVTACPPYALEPVEWSFPILGSFSYKGFFDEQKAESLQSTLQLQGLDTNIREVGGWSTLGWFKDPVLSGMLDRPVGELAELIIHELTHGTLFVKDSVRFNENLATFVGHVGAIEFLTMKYGAQSDSLHQYISRWRDRREITNHMVRGAHYLDDVYVKLSTNEDENADDIKKQAIEQIVQSTDSLQLNNRKFYTDIFQNFHPNNTYFASYLRYHGDFEKLEQELKKVYGGSIRQMLLDYTRKYPSL